jgi:arylsulfatase A-like enzyme
VRALAQRAHDRAAPPATPAVRGNAGKLPIAAAQCPAAPATSPWPVRAAARPATATALVGKWGLGDTGRAGAACPPGNTVSITFFGYLDQHPRAQSTSRPFGCAARSGENLRNRPAANVPAEMWADGAGWSTNRVDYTPDLLADEALRWVEKQSEHPFFLFWSLITPHANNEATRGAGNGQEVPDLGAYREREWPEPDRGFAATVARLDADVGRMLALLDRKGIAGDTLVLFTSDNGPHQEGGNRPEFFDSNGPLNGLKRSLTDGGIRVPALARWPGRIPAGRDCATPVWFADLLPTFADLAGAPPPAPPLDGTSLRPLFLGAEAPSAPRTFYWEFHEGGFSQAVLYQGRWKGIRTDGPDAPVKLFDQLNDAAEKTDVAGRHPEIAARIGEYLKTARTPLAEWEPRWEPEKGSNR